jgi:Rho family protein
VRHYCRRDTPILLVGCKADLRPATADSKWSGVCCVSRAEAEAAASAMGAVCYIECSAFDGRGIHDVFGVVARECMRARRSRSSVRVNVGCVVG